MYESVCDSKREQKRKFFRRPRCSYDVTAASIGSIMKKLSFDFRLFTFINYKVFASQGIHKQTAMIGQKHCGQSYKYGEIFAFSSLN